MYNVTQEQYLFRTAVLLIEEGQNTGFQEEASGDFSLNKTNETGYFLLHVIDSGKNQMTWERLKIQMEAEGEHLTECYVMADNEYEAFNRVWEDGAVLPDEKIRQLLKKDGIQIQNEDDFLLYPLKGRYLWIGVMCSNLENHKFILKGIEVTYPKQTFVNYLPSIYADEGGFIERYIEIFQNLYLELEHVIEQLPQLLEPYQMPERFLDEIGSWIGIDNSRQIFNSEQMRKLLLKFVALGKKKGTKEALAGMLEVLLGEEPVIVEYFKWRDHADDEQAEDFARLYGSGAYTFTVIVNPEEVLRQVPKEEQEIFLSKLKEKIIEMIEQFRPALTIYKLVLLKREMCLDGHTYLGINTYLPCDEEQLCTL